MKPPISPTVIRCGGTDYSHVKTLPWKIVNPGRPNRNQRGKLFDFDGSLWFGIAHLLPLFPNEKKSRICRMEGVLCH